jgi:hypothetical protein
VVEATGVPARALRIPPERIRLGVGGKPCQPKQVSSFRSAPATDPNPWAHPHTVTTGADPPDTAAIGMRHDRAFSALMIGPPDWRFVVVGVL